MDQEQFSQITDLIKESGDGRYIIINGNKPTFVIMRIDEYRKLAQAKKRVDDLAEKELIEKINRTIAEWKAKQEEKRLSRFELFGDDKEEVKNLAPNFSKDKDDFSYYYDIEQI